MASERHAVDSLLQTLRAGRDSHALFLDVDGTLIDIAPRPESVHVPDALPALLSGLHRYLGGALALVSGREISDLDQLMSPVASPCAGAHGAQIRLTAGAVPTTSQSVQPLPDTLRAELAQIASDDKLLIEDKTYSVAIHYRDSPQLQEPLRQKIESTLDGATGEELRPQLMAGKMIYEIKYNTFDKGTALDVFLADAPFAGRRPVVIGDDTTDEYAFSRALDHGGMTFSVGRALTGAGAVFESPEQVRQTLQQLLAEALTETL
jgi:trehalose 6-phosphate phosphatase